VLDANAPCDDDAVTRRYSPAEAHRLLERFARAASAAFLRRCDAAPADIQIIAKSLFLRRSPAALSDHHVRHSLCSSAVKAPTVTTHHPQLIERRGAQRHTTAAAGPGKLRQLCDHR
jgi:hypothetical protein